MVVSIGKGRAVGTIAAPPSKSMAHRALISGALSSGSIVRGVDFSEDIQATLDGLKALGAKVLIEGDTVSIGGLDPFHVPPTRFDCRESGSTLRFLLPLCLLSGNAITLTGSRRLFARSVGVYETLCRQQGMDFALSESSVTVRGRWRGGELAVPGDVSSQFISGLLFVLPLLDGDSTLRILGRTESRPYIDLTLQTLAAYGIDIQQPFPDLLAISGGQRYQARDSTVEGDYSNAAFFEALTVLGGDVTVTGLRADSRQGDRVYREYFTALSQGTPTLDIADCPDLGPILMALAAACHGATLNNTQRLQHKECDRGTAMANELRKLGASVTVGDNTIVVDPTPLSAPTQTLCGHNDHRVVMALAVLCSVYGGTIEGAEAVAKSLPDFFERLQTLGIEVAKS